MKRLVVALLFLTSSCLADTWISIGGGSDHFCHTCGYNNFNPGLGIQYDYDTDIRLIAGGYYNSFYKASFYAGGAYQPFHYGLVRVGLMGAAVSNYNNLKIPAMVLPAVSIESNGVGVDILGGPSLGNLHGLVTANLKFALP